MTTPAIELAQYLADNGVGARGGDAQWGIHVSREPAAPNDVITLYDTGGDPPPAISVDLRVRAIQVRVRAADYAAGMGKMQEIYALLAQPSIEETVNPIERNIGIHRYVGVWLAGEITHIGRDDNDRFLFTANYDTHLQPL